MATLFTLKSVRGPFLSVAFGIATISGMGIGSTSKAAEPWPAEVQAAYRIQFNSLEIGQFTFNSSVHNRTYSISGNAGISALLGIVRWNGITKVSGAVAGDAPKPAGYSFEFNSSTSSGVIRMGFDAGAVKSLDFNPPIPDAPGTVPVVPVHMRGVLDPLSAVMAMSRPRDGNPCTQRLPIFDGKARFDLVLSPKGEAPIAEVSQTGPAEMLRVCRIRVVPIAGHVENEKTEQLRRALGIEIAFRSIPSAGLFVPHRITIPTFAGSVELIAQTVNIRTQREQIALVN